MAETEYLCSDKPAKFLTEPAVPRSRLLSLGPEMYPCNKQRMLSKDLTRFMLGSLEYAKSSEKLR